MTGWNALGLGSKTNAKVLAILMVAILTVSAALVFVTNSEGSNRSSYEGGSITYHLGSGVYQVSDEGVISETVADNLDYAISYEDGTCTSSGTPSEVTVKLSTYYGIKSTEYNPEFWTGWGEVPLYSGGNKGMWNWAGPTVTATWSNIVISVTGASAGATVNLPANCGGGTATVSAEGTITVNYSETVHKVFGGWTTDSTPGPMSPVIYPGDVVAWDVTDLYAIWIVPDIFALKSVSVTSGVGGYTPDKPLVQSYAELGRNDGDYLADDISGYTRYSTDRASVSALTLQPGDTVDSVNGWYKAKDGKLVAESFSVENADTCKIIKRGDTPVYKLMKSDNTVRDYNTGKVVSVRLYTNEDCTMEYVIASQSKTVADINALTAPAKGDMYKVTNSGRINKAEEGTSSSSQLSVVANDVIRFNGTAWQKIGSDASPSTVYTNIGTYKVASSDASYGNYILLYNMPVTATTIEVVEHTLGSVTVDQVNDLRAPEADDAYLMTNAGEIAGSLQVTANDVIKYNNGSWSIVAHRLGSMNVSQINNLKNPKNDDAYLMTNAGTIKGGVSVTANDVIKYNGSSWSVVAHSLGSMTVSQVNQLLNPEDGDKFFVTKAGTITGGLEVPANTVISFNGSGWMVGDSFVSKTVTEFNTLYPAPAGGSTYYIDTTDPWNPSGKITGGIAVKTGDIVRFNSTYTVVLVDGSNVSLVENLAVGDKVAGVSGWYKGKDGSSIDGVYGVTASDASYGNYILLYRTAATNYAVVEVDGDAMFSSIYYLKNSTRYGLGGQNNLPAGTYRTENPYTIYDDSHTERSQKINYKAKLAIWSGTTNYVHLGGNVIIDNVTLDCSGENTHGGSANVAIVANGHRMIIGTNTSTYDLETNASGQGRDRIQRAPNIIGGAVSNNVTSPLERDKAVVLNDGGGRFKLQCQHRDLCDHPQRNLQQPGRRGAKLGRQRTAAPLHILGGEGQHSHRYHIRSRR